MKPVLKDTSNGQIRDMLMGRLNEIEGIKADVPRDPTLEERATSLIKSVVNKDDEKPDPNDVFENSGEADEVLSVSVDKLWSGADSGICTLDVLRIVRGSGLERKASTLPMERIKGLSGTAKADDEPEDTGVAPPHVTVEATILNNASDDVEINSGDSITWTNEDDQARTISGDSIESTTIEPGETYTHNFLEEGTYEINVEGGESFTVTVLSGLQPEMQGTGVPRPQDGTPASGG